MANDLFGGLGGLMKGLSGFMPQDDPNVKLMNAQTELGELKRQENELFSEIGRQAFAANPSAYPQAEKLRLIQMNIADMDAKFTALKNEKERTEAGQKAITERSTCPACGHVNPDGTKFCQECGGKLGVAACQSCGAPLPPGSRFCGECGARQEG